MKTTHQRPDYVKDRSAFGDWEGDLMIFRKEHGKANVASLIERKTRMPYFSETMIAAQNI